MVVISPFTTNLLDYNGVNVADLVDNGPLSLAGVSIGENIINVDGKEINNINELSAVLSEKNPGDKISLMTDKGSYDIILSDNEGKAYLGTSLSVDEVVYSERALDKYGKTSLDFIFWFSQLLFWLWVINIGVGLFNLLPLGPIDGGKMLFVGLTKFVSKENAMRAWKTVSFFLLLLLIINLLPWFIKLFNFIF